MLLLRRVSDMCPVTKDAKERRLFIDECVFQLEYFEDARKRVKGM